MQAAMSSELMNSWDRNFLFGERRPLIPRSHSLNIGMTRNKKSSFHFIPRVKMNLKKENKPLEEPKPDYDEQEEDEFVIRTIENENDLNEEPIADYDDAKPTINVQSDEKTTLTHSDQELSTSFIVPQTSANDTDEQISTPPIPPPLPDLYTEPKQRAFRCRTIANDLSSDHKLILKDEEKSGIDLFSILF
jgi:hypothetical protein